MSDAPQTNELTSPAAWRATFAELLATLLFVFIGAGTVVVTGQILGEDMTSARLLTIAVAHGMAIALLVTATANISGGHINPAVTLATMLTRHTSLIRGLMYIVAQLVGAVLGAALLVAVLPESGGLGAHSLGPGVSAGQGVLVEIILTFLLVFVVYATAIDPKGIGHLAPMAIGLVVLVDILVGLPLTGASMNPARSFGPALLSGQWADHWVYWIGPAIGGTLAAMVYRWTFLNR